MKKLILQNTLVTQILLYGGLALIMWPGMLRTLGTVGYGSTVSNVLLYLGLAVVLAGVGLRLYQLRQLGQTALRQYLLRFALGIALIAVLMATGLLRTPAFLQHIF